MDIFNKKLVKQLREENEQLKRELTYRPLMRVYEGKTEEFKARVWVENRDVSIEIFKHSLASQIVEGLIDRELIDYDVEYDPMTRRNYITARLFVGRKEK